MTLPFSGFSTESNRCLADVRISHEPVSAARQISPNGNGGIGSALSVADAI
ncbi:MAG: hypothetical protein KGJ66_12800 [Alphaproteobacteria bacterium]|nr:hypothetical protein [Alphaproteobacteria bacterium]